MAITKDLKPDEFEITICCPVGACVVHHTYAYTKELKKYPSDLKDVKRRVVEMTTEAHKAGKHNIGGSA